MILSELLQRIQSLYSKGVQSDDTRLSSRHIYSKLKSVRSRLISEKAKKKQNISQFNFQTLSCVELEQVPIHDCPCIPVPGCMILRTKYPLPKPLSDYNTILIDSVTSLDGSVVYSEIKFEEIKYKASNKYTAKKPEYFIRNNYLYIFTPTHLSTKVTTIMITGLFEDPLEAHKFPSPCKCDDIFTEQTFHIPNDSITSMPGQVNKTMNIKVPTLSSGLLHNNTIIIFQIDTSGSFSENDRITVYNSIRYFKDRLKNENPAWVGEIIIHKPAVSVNTQRFGYSLFCIYRDESTIWAGTTNFTESQWFTHDIYGNNEYLTLDYVREYLNTNNDILYISMVNENSRGDYQCPGTYHFRMFEKSSNTSAVPSEGNPLNLQDIFGSYLCTQTGESDYRTDLSLFREIQNEIISSGGSLHTLLYPVLSNFSYQGVLSYPFFLCALKYKTIDKALDANMFSGGYINYWNSNNSVIFGVYDFDTNDFISSLNDFYNSPAINNIADDLYFKKEDNVELMLTAYRRDYGVIMTADILYNDLLRFLEGEEFNHIIEIDRSYNVYFDYTEDYVVTYNTDRTVTIASTPNGVKHTKTFNFPNKKGVLTPINLVLESTLYIPDYVVLNENGSMTIGNNVTFTTEVTVNKGHLEDGIHSETVQESICTETCVPYFPSTDFPIDNDMVDALVELTAAEVLTVFNQGIEDSTNNSKDTPGGNSK